jgi:sterol desaturase/sphingolipid hydroxylase (fatty acid hydroxylase superfamily)
VTHETWIRLGVFASVFVLMAGLEAVAPRRGRSTPRSERWLGNLGLVTTGSLLVRVMLPLAAVGTALVAREQGWGLLNAVTWPAWAEFALAFLVLDLAIYLQHVVFHAVPALWRLHGVHHADRDLDVTSGLRFHPVELLISMGWKMGVVAATGAGPWAVLVFEVVLNATAMFNHANIGLTGRLDALLRLLVVTPDMHRVHHSVIRRETNSNFGFNLPWWDRLLGTYRAQPREGHQGMTLGLRQFQDPAVRTGSLWWMLWTPFRRAPGPYPFNRDADPPR